MVTKALRAVVVACAVVGSLCDTHDALGWGAGHNDSSRLGASLAPEPFKSNLDLCVFAHYPDAIQDHAVGHGRDGYLRRLMTFEAIDALRADDLPKAMFFASTATHYLTDRACIAHSGQAWYSNKGWRPFLPLKYQGVRVPHGKESIYYAHIKGYYHDTVLKLPPPEFCRKVWDRTHGSTNAYFDSLPSVKRLVKPDMLRTFDHYTFNDAFMYGRWYAIFISLDMLDSSSVKSPPLRFRDPRAMQAVCIEELINGAAICASYYTYLTTAAGTDIPSEWAEVLPPDDKLLGWVDPGAVVLIGRGAPWSVERAALVLAMELSRAERRRPRASGAKPADTRPNSLVIRHNPAAPDLRLKTHNVIALACPADADLLKCFAGRKVLPGRRGLIAVQSGTFAEGRQAILLSGTSLSDTIYLVDYLLDLAWAPVHGRSPAGQVVAALQETWGGWKLIKDMRDMHGKAAVDHARACPHRHQESRAADSKRYRELLGSGLKGSGSEVEWCQFFLLQTRLPDGRDASDMIASGTDYSALIDHLEPASEPAKRK